jgi:hypothetical protein
MANNGQSDGIQASPNLPFKRKDRKNLRSRPRVGGRFITQIESAEFDRPLVEPLGCEGSCRCRVEGFATSRPVARDTTRGSVVDDAGILADQREHGAADEFGKRCPNEDDPPRIRPPAPGRGERFGIVGRIANRRPAARFACPSYRSLRIMRSCKPTRPKPIHRSANAAGFSSACGR